MFPWMSFDSLPVRFTSQITPRMSFPISKTFDVSWILVFCICSFQGTSDWCLSVIRIKKALSFPTLITGKDQLSDQHFPAVSGWQPQRSCLCLFYLIKHFPLLSFLGFRQPPALPHRLQCSTIGLLGLNRRVRDGYGCFPQAHRRRKHSLSMLPDNSTVKHIHLLCLP